MRLPMGIACSPDIFQYIMIASLGNLDYVLVYIDDILLLQSHDETEYDHLRKMEEVLGKNNTSNTDNNSQQGR